MSAYHDGTGLIKRIKDKRREKREAIEEAATKSLEDSLALGPPIVQGQYDHDFRRFGREYATGDAIAREGMKDIIINLQMALLFNLRVAWQDDIEPDYRTLQNASDDSRVNAVVCLGQLYQRMSQAAPIRTMAGTPRIMSPGSYVTSNPLSPPPISSTLGSSTLPQISPPPPYITDGSERSSDPSSSRLDRKPNVSARPEQSTASPTDIEAALDDRLSDLRLSTSTSSSAGRPSFGEKSSTGRPSFGENKSTMDSAAALRKTLFGSRQRKDGVQLPQLLSTRDTTGNEVSAHSPGAVSSTSAVSPHPGPEMVHPAFRADTTATDADWTVEPSRTSYASSGNGSGSSSDRHSSATRHYSRDNEDITSNPWNHAGDIPNDQSGPDRPSALGRIASTATNKSTQRPVVVGGTTIPLRNKASYAPSITSSIHSNDSSQTGTTTISNATSTTLTNSTLQPSISRQTSTISRTLYLPSEENKFAGFCKGAWKLQIGMKKAFGAEYRPAGMYGQIPFWRCQKCCFEGPMTGTSRATRSFDDRIRTAAGGIQYRWAFLAKSHVYMKSVGMSGDGSSGAFGCIFCCAETRKTPTFGNVRKLMEHLEAVHRGRYPGFELRDRTNCIVDRMAGEWEDFDINLPARVVEMPG